MTHALSTASVLSLLALGGVVGQPTAAAAAITGFTGQAQSSVAGCPFLIWRLARHDDGQITGIVYYSDMSGVSQARGNLDQSGHFQIQLTSSMGSGPVGTVTGTKSADGKIIATMTGQGCANMQWRMNPAADLNQYHESAG